MKIFIFFHVALINHYREIVMEQLKMLTDSGLYAACENMYVGCVGDQNEKHVLNDLFSNYPKINIAYHSNSLTEYEFCTLKLLREKAVTSEESFYALYFHGKGVSYSRSRQRAYLGGNYWRAYMSYYNISRWKDCVEKLDEGYDMCGVKFLQINESPAKKPHYSGNYFWIKSEYVKTLKPIEFLNHSDRFEAEFWACSASPKAATLCQAFVDYNTRGVFQPPTQ